MVVGKPNLDGWVFGVLDILGQFGYLGMLRYVWIFWGMLQCFWHILICFGYVEVWLFSYVVGGLWLFMLCFWVFLGIFKYIYVFFCLFFFCKLNWLLLMPWDYDVVWFIFIKFSSTPVSCSFTFKRYLYTRRLITHPNSCIYKLVYG